MFSKGGSKGMFWGGGVNSVNVRNRLVKLCPTILVARSPTPHPLPTPLLISITVALPL